METNTKEYENSILKKISIDMNNIMEKLAQLTKSNDDSNKQEETLLKERLGALKLMKSELIRENEKRHSNLEYKMNENEETKLLLTMRTSHELVMLAYKKVDNMAMYEHEKNELKVINEFIPKQPTQEEIVSFTKQIIDEYLASMPNDYTPSPKDMGKIIPKVKAKYPNVDGNIVKKILLG